jgi:site-specific recombinase
VAFSTANTGMAATIVEPTILLDIWPLVVAGIAGIAAVNLVVSFWLALNVAILSRGFTSVSVARRSRSASETA